MAIVYSISHTGISQVDEERVVDYKAITYNLQNFGEKIRVLEFRSVKGIFYVLSLDLFNVKCVFR